ncbi:MAG TPA: EamA family transporter [Anaerolineae bacterium]|nr:EamA family transporter [Anaerolineae bacterium]
MNLLLLFILGSIWGTSFLFIKIVVGEVPPMTLVAGRLGLASLAMWAFLRLRGVPFPRERRLWGIYALTGLLNGALPFTLISWGEQYIPSGLAALLQSTTPIFTIILAHFLTHDDRFTAKKVLGIVLGFAGVGLLMWPELRSGVRASVWGQLAIVGSSISYAIASIFARERLHGQPPLVSAAGQFTMGFVYILPLSLLIERPFALSPSWTAIASWATLALLGTVIAYAIYYTLLQRTNATFTTTVTYIVPVNGLILGSLILHERIYAGLFISLALILSGVLLVKTKDRETTQRVDISPADLAD